MNFTYDNEESDDNGDDESQWTDLNDNEVNDKRPLYYGSSISVTDGSRHVATFYLNANLDKQKVTALLRLIKSLLRQPTILPCTWKSVNKFGAHFSSSSTTIHCSDCYELCTTISGGRKSCTNPNCATSLRQRRSAEIIEIVRFDIRSQIQTVMKRNIDFLNKSHLFPSSDTCVAD